jgi:hypothetical protein
LTSDQILLQNKIKLEQQQTKEYEAKLKIDSDRLLEIQTRQLNEV